VTPEDVHRAWEAINGEPDPRKALAMEARHYLNVLNAIASLAAYPDAETLATAVMHECSVRPVRDDDSPGLRSVLDAARRRMGIGDKINIEREDL
jgi:hypothetical protein